MLQKALITAAILSLTSIFASEDYLSTLQGDYTLALPNPSELYTLKWFNIHLNDPTNLVWIRAKVEVVMKNGESQEMQFKAIKDRKFAFRHSHTSENPWVSCLTFKKPMTVRNGARIEFTAYERGLTRWRTEKVKTTVEAPKRFQKAKKNFFEGPAYDGVSARDGKVFVKEGLEKTWFPINDVNELDSLRYSKTWVERPNVKLNYDVKAYEAEENRRLIANNQDPASECLILKPEDLELYGMSL